MTLLKHRLTGRKYKPVGHRIQTIERDRNGGLGKKRGEKKALNLVL